MDITKLQDLFKQMTREEKIGQTVQLTGNFYDDDTAAITGPMKEMNVSANDLTRVGSILGGTGAADIRRIQDDYMKKNRLGIPLLFMADVIHGYRTIFPIPLALASSWNPALFEETAQMAARESATAGVHVTFSPMVDLVRDARWGRVMESTGEDPFLNEEFAKAMVRGYQGIDLEKDTTRLAACVKHFAAYGAPTAGLDYNTVDLSEHALRENYFSGYEAAIKAGAKMVMSSFNTIKGIPATGNKWLLRTVLREEMGFDGVVISDWAGINELIPHGIAENLKEAAKLSLEAGIDIDMMSGGYLHHLEEIIQENPEMETLLDEAVWRILLLKNELGLFENPYRGADEAAEARELFNETNRKLAQKAAEESVVLLKNNGVLPLKTNEKIALVGPKKETQDLLGSWSLNGLESETQSLAEVLEQAVLIEDNEVFNGLNSYKLSELYTADKIIVALGEDSFMSGEAASRSNIQLPKNQLLLLDELKQLGKPIIAVIITGRPLDLSDVAHQADAIVNAWFPGSLGAQAIADILYGKVNPSGRLTMSFPRTVGQVPIYYNRHTTGRPFTNKQQDEKYLARYLDTENTPLYPFGFGLSYATFNYSDLTVSKSRFTKNEEITVTVSVTNTSDRSGTETVQLYVRDHVAQVVRPIKELKQFKRITLEPNETREVVFQLREEYFHYLHPDGTLSSDPGSFELMVGPNAEMTQAVTVELIRE